MTLKISVIIGTRPEAIKLAPVILKMRRLSSIKCHVCVTAQHREMLDQVLNAFEIVPDSDLNIMQTNQSLSYLTARGIEAVDDYLKEETPDMIMVQGDTTTTFVASLAAFYNGIPVSHVEAGLRTGNVRAPWPEEANRVMVSRLATLHFAPTEQNKNNLLKEGVSIDNIFVTGNTVIDALFLSLDKVRKNPPKIDGIDNSIMDHDSKATIVLITGHRRESIGKGIESICKAISKLANDFPEVKFIYPVHLNPNVKSTVTRMLGEDSGGKMMSNINLINPLPYLPFIALMNRSSFILTDSGGIQEEAPSLGKPVLVMRDTTERSEAIRSGTVKLVGTKYEKIVNEASVLLTDRRAYVAMSRAHNPYGDGKAAQRIIDVILRFVK
jgi:UDP-N-acetylglucosamine 2-epimerase (non-hydrolysing)